MIFDAHKRIELTHLAVIVILAINIIFFTQNSYAMIIQTVLIIAVYIHHKDDEYIKRSLLKAQNRLREDKNLFDKTVLVSETDLQGIITYVNTKFSKISGYTKAELIGQNHNIIRDEKMPDTLFKTLWQHLEADEPWHGKIRNRKKDGAYYWVDTYIYPLHVNGKKIGYKAIRFDITDKILAESRFSIVQKMIDTSDDMIILIEHNAITLVNETLLNFLHVNNLEEFLQRYSSICDLIAQHNDFTFDKERCFEEIIRLDHTKIILENPNNALAFTFKVQVNSDNENFTIIKFQDISHFEKERVYLSQKLHESEEEITIKDSKLIEQSKRFDFAINSSRDGFWDYDLVTFKFYLNSGWKKRLGFNEDEEISYLDYMNLIVEEERFEHHKTIHEAIENYDGKLDFVHYRIKYTLNSRHNELISIEDVGDIFFDAAKNPIRITGFHRDISDVVRQTKIIESQNRLAAMGEMLSNISHQWRQPIGAINNILNDIEFDIELEEMQSIESKAFLENSHKIKELTKYLTNTINDFANISNKDKYKESFELEDAVREALKILSISLQKHHIDVQVSKSDNVTQKLFGYKRELVQVIVNIIANAKDAFNEMHIENAQIVITLEAEENAHFISIADNAGGIPSSIINKIFEPYFTTKHQSMGTGIGLYMSKKIIKEYFFGDITISNESGGAKFTIWLDNDFLK